MPTAVIAHRTPAARKRAAGVTAFMGACVAALLGACDAAVPAPPRASATDTAHQASTGDPGDTSHRSRPGYIIDSILPPDEMLRRFRSGLRPVTALEGGARSRDALVAQFSGAVASRDTSTLRSLVVTRAEFAYLLYPESPYVRPPYQTAPGVIWMQLSQASGKGLTRLLREDFSLDTIAGYRCAPQAEREGANLLWRGCTATARLADGSTLEGRLFGVIVERQGRFKFASLATDF